ncbi:8972_t:CDS:2, partial [Gigaspora margarita]
EAHIFYIKKKPDFEFHKFYSSIISKIASEKWHSESEEIKLKFERLADTAKPDLISQLPMPDLSKTLSSPLPTQPNLNTR